MTTSSLCFAPLPTLAWTVPNWALGLLIVGFGAVCVLLVLAILIQKPQGGGLSGAFGAGASGSGQTAFGTKTGDALTWMTIIIFVVYLGAAIGMNYTMRPEDNTAKPPAASSPPAGDSTTSPTGTPAPAEKPAAPQTGTTPPATSNINVKPPEGGTPPATPPAPANPNPGTPDPAPVTPAPVTPGTTPPATNPPAAPPAEPPAAPPATPR